MNLFTIIAFFKLLVSALVECAGFCALYCWVIVNFDVVFFFCLAKLLARKKETWECSEPARYLQIHRAYTNRFTLFSALTGVVISALFSWVIFAVSCVVILQVPRGHSWWSASERGLSRHQPGERPGVHFTGRGGPACGDEI